MFGETLEASRALTARPTLALVEFVLSVTIIIMSLAVLATVISLVLGH
jgi:hypothetical protein